jgi:hypothetical protein
LFPSHWQGYKVVTSIDEIETELRNFWSKK